MTVGWKSLGKGPLIGIGVLGVLVLAAGAFWYQQHRWASACEDDGMRELEKAMQPFRELEEARKSGDAARIRKAESAAQQATIEARADRAKRSKALASGVREASSCR